VPGFKGQKAREKNGMWQGGVRHSRGYVYILDPSHPFANGRGYVLRSRLLLEKKLGRYMEPNEIAYHKNGIRDDDRLGNLEVKQKGCHWTVSSRAQLAKKLSGSGNPHWVKDRSKTGQAYRMGRDFTHYRRMLIRKKADHMCEICGADASRLKGEVDHILPVGAGGSGDLENGWLLCKDCHKKKFRFDLWRVQIVRNCKLESVKL